MSSKNYLDKNGLTYFWGKVQNEISPKANTSDVLTKANTTSYTPSANYHPATKKYVDDKGFNDLSDIFIIECTTENNEAVVDKTWNEITAAYNAGKKIFAKYESAVFPLLAFSQSSSSVQGYVAFYFPSAWFNPSLDPYYGQWESWESCLVVWDTTWSGQGGEMDAWDTPLLPERVPRTTYYVDQNDSNNFCLQHINNDYGNSIFMERYDQNGSSAFNMRSSGIDITSTLGVRIRNLVTPTNDTDAATKGYVDNKGFADLSDVFVITCSVDGSNNHVVDKTWTEIITAINAGKDVYIKCFDYYLYPLTGFEASGSTQGYASFYTPFTWGNGTLENYTITVWDTTFSGNTHESWEVNTGTSPVLYFNVSYWNDSYTIGSGVTATDLYNLINSGAVVILKYSGLYYYLSQYYDMDEIVLDFVSDNGWSFEKFTVTDRLGTTTITYSYEYKPLIKAGTGDSAVIINDYYAVPPCVASGNGALSEGGATEASGTLSHAEGRMTIAKGNYSHAENQHTYAYGVGSHAEGGTLSGNITISGAANATTYTITGSPIIYGTAAEIALYVMVMYGIDYYRPVSVTVADNVITSFTLESTLDDTNALTNESGKLYFCTVAKGKGSHAEGGATYAHADYSHAEGKQTHAAGANSHTEGLVTTAASANQHVQGKYNIVDSAGTYAHIVGNGTSSSAQSNAHTLDWNGNGWYAGKLTVGSAPTNNMDVATKQYVDTAVSGVSSSLMLTATVNNTTVTFTGATPSEVYTAASGGALVQATIPLVWGDGIFDLKEYNYDSGSGDYYFIFSNITSDMGRPQNRLVQCNLSTGSATSWTGSLQESCLVGASIFEGVDGVFIDDTTLANNQILRYDVNYGSFVNADAPQDTNTTYTISISGNVITLTPSSGQAQSITLPVYNGGVA